jgi:all-trans-retinol 13,14-reductase
MSGGHDADVVVVGAGLGGLTAAAHLAAAGRHVVVVDRQTAPGGNTITFTHHGFEFDVGVHYVGDCGPGGSIPAVLAPLGIDLTFRPLDADGFDTYHLPGEVFRVPAGVEAFRERLVQRFPDEREGIDAYLATVVAIDRAVGGTGGRRAVPAGCSTASGCHPGCAPCSPARAAPTTCRPRGRRSCCTPCS